MHRSAASGRRAYVTLLKSIDAIAIASVVPPLNFTLKRMSETYFGATPLFIDNTIDTGVPILYEPAADVGADRIVDAVAAIHKYGKPCIVVDFGTATPFDASTLAELFARESQFRLMPYFNGPPSCPASKSKSRRR